MSVSDVLRGLEMDFRRGHLEHAAASYGGATVFAFAAASGGVITLSTRLAPWVLKHGCDVVMVSGSGLSDRKAHELHELLSGQQIDELRIDRELGDCRVMFDGDLELHVRPTLPALRRGTSEDVWELLGPDDRGIAWTSHGRLIAIQDRDQFGAEDAEQSAVARAH